jgi:hypothetical protein
MSDATQTSESIDQVEFKAGDVVVPLGYVLSDAYGTRFRPNVVALLAVLTPLTIVSGWALPRIIRALKTKRR